MKIRRVKLTSVTGSIDEREFTAGQVDSMTLSMIVTAIGMRHNSPMWAVGELWFEVDGLQYSAHFDPADMQVLSPGKLTIGHPKSAPNVDLPRTLVAALVADHGRPELLDDYGVASVDHDPRPPEEIVAEADARWVVVDEELT